MKTIMIAVAVAAAGLAAVPSAADARDRLECRIQETNGNGDARLLAVARLPKASDAKWHFDVRTFGAGGTSSTSQSGGSRLPGGRWVLLGEVHTYYSTGYEATLELSSPHGRTRCRKAGR